MGAAGWTRSGREHEFHRPYFESCPAPRLEILSLFGLVSRTLLSSISEPTFGRSGLLILGVQMECMAKATFHRNRLLYIPS